MSARHRKHANPFSIRATIVRPEWDVVFGRRAPMALDVGFGLGSYLLELGARHPEWNVVGLEIRPHLVAEVMADAQRRGLTNVHALLANVNLHFGALFEGMPIAFVAVNFPDPWYKKRHHKRRVVQPLWLQQLGRCLIDGAELHAMSDYEPIALQIRDTIEAAPGFTNLDGVGQYAPTSTTGIVTEREITHQRRGDPIFRLRFRFDRQVFATVSAAQVAGPLHLAQRDLEC